MKRGAEKQLTQLNHDLDDDDEVRRPVEPRALRSTYFLQGSEERGFRKADDSVLATRV